MTHYFDHNQSNSSFIPAFHIKSTTMWLPPKLPILEHYLNNAHSILENDFRNYQPARVGTFRHATIIKQLLNNDDIIFRASDKNLGLSCLDSKFYDDLCMKILQSDNYIEIDKGSLFGICNHIKAKLLTAIRVHGDEMHKFSPQVHKFLRDKIKKDHHLPRFYGLPKIHKLPNLINFQSKLTLRPIVTSTNWITTAASTVVSELLKPIVSRLPFILKDSFSFIAEHDNVALPDHCAIITMDVSDLYGSMHHEDVLMKLHELNDWLVEFNQNTNTPISLIPEFCFDLIKIILENNYLSFKDTIFKQKNGMAMGTNMAVLVANAYGFAAIEIPLSGLISSFTIYKRYIDDICLIFCLLHHSPQQIFDNFNTVHPNLKFTMEWSKYEVAFLDARVMIKENKLQFSCYQKPLNKYLYITPKSFHPIHTLKGFIKAELIRYLRLSTSEDDFLVTRNLFRLRLLDRGYTRNFINRVFMTVQFSDRMKFLNRIGTATEAKIPFVLRFSRRTKHLRPGKILADSQIWLDNLYGRQPAPTVVLSFKSNVSMGRLLTKNRHPKLSVPIARPNSY